VRSYALNKEYNRKLKLRWLGLYLIINMPLEVLVNIINIYRDSKVKKYYLNNLKVYIP
jgi:hypothetical protein